MHARMEKIECRGVVALAAAVVATQLLPPFGAAAPPAAATDLGSGCTRSCGNISIPYPFGVEPGCYHAAGFSLTCRNGSHGHGPPGLFLGNGTVQVLEISVPSGTVRINSSRVEFTRVDDGDTVNATWGRGLPEGGPYFLSESVSSVVVIGCDLRIDLLGGESNNLVSSCTAICPGVSSNDSTIIMQSGISKRFSCCEQSISIGYSFYNIQMHNRSLSKNKYSVYIVDDAFNYTGDMRQGKQELPEALPATLDWVISNSTCLTNETAPECRSANSCCQDSTADGHGGFLCHCSYGYQGNPYIIDGCKEMDEWKHPEECQCPCGTYGNPCKKEGCIIIKKSFTGLSIGLAVGSGLCLLILALGGPFIMRKIQMLEVKSMKEKIFNQNHGLLLRQLISRNTDIGERMIITLREIERATNYFDRACVVGGGGHGVVFKGIIDLHVVAIKKSKIIVQREIDEFINEVVVLSQVNHRNVVKLLGCCLETEVPLLVYEFISNGTLYHHLHVEGSTSLSWGDE